MAGVELEGQVVLIGKVDTARPAPITQCQPGRLLDLTSRQNRSKCLCRVLVRPFLPAQGACICVLGLDSNRAGGVAPEDRSQCLPQIFERGNLDAGLLMDVLDLYVAPGAARPREVVEEEVGSGFIGLA